jgi:hypothetical protein
MAYEADLFREAGEIQNGGFLIKQVFVCRRIYR